MKKHTYDWNLILGVFLIGLALSEGVYAVCNIPLFYWYGETYLDGITLIVMCIIYIIFLFKELDGFMVKHLNKF